MAFSNENNSYRIVGYKSPQHKQISNYSIEKNDNLIHKLKILIKQFTNLGQVHKECGGVQHV